MRTPFRTALLSAPVIALVAALLAGPAARADDDHDRDHDRARAALREGRILPLERIAALAKERFGGDILDVELEDEDDGFRYELKLMAGDGRILKLEYDAATGDLLRAKARDRKTDGHKPDGRKPVERR